MTKPTRVLGRWGRLAITLAIVTPAAVWGGPAAGGDPDGTLEVVKVVQGDQPPGSFEVEVVCDQGTIPLTFDGSGTQSLKLQATDQDCQLNETNDLGALSVSYDCQDIVAPANPSDEGCQPVGPGGNFFQMQDSAQVVRITVTNTFPSAPPEPPAPAADDVPPPAAQPAAATAGTPTFTG